MQWGLWGGGGVWEVWGVFEDVGVWCLSVWVGGFFPHSVLDMVHDTIRMIYHVQRIYSLPTKNAGPSRLPQSSSRL